MSETETGGPKDVAAPKARLHLGKGWRGWPAFLFEIGTIVLGILIALAIDQTAQTIRDDHDAEVARQSVRAEVVADITRVAQRGEPQGCVDRRLDELQAIIDGVGQGGRIARPSFVGRPPRLGIERQRWDAAAQSGRASNFTADEQRRYGLIYTTLDYFYAMETGEQAAWAKLSALEGVDRLTDDGRLAMRTALGEARFYSGSIRQVTKLLLDRSLELNLKPTPKAVGGGTVCWPIDLPADEVRKRRQGSLGVF